MLPQSLDENLAQLGGHDWKTGIDTPAVASGLVQKYILHRSQSCF